MEDDIEWGTRRIIDGRARVYYDGYWVRAYEVPADTLSAKKALIEALTRRLFNHVEHGLNVPGTRLKDARRAFDSETDPQRRRVKAGMLAGALFNRAADVFTKLVELQSLGLEIQPDNALMRECGEYLKEALTLGKMVLHRSGEEGIDELWGEPFKAFAFPIEEFYKSRYIKIALAMSGIDRMGVALEKSLAPLPLFAGVAPLIHDFTEAAKAKCETLRTDEDIFDVWTSFVVSTERLVAFNPVLSERAVAETARSCAEGLSLIRAAVDLVTCITRARVPMSKSTQAFLDRCETHRRFAELAAAQRSVA
jgi:hypothetical protein